MKIAGTHTTPRWEVVVWDGWREVYRLTVLSATKERAESYARSIYPGYARYEATRKMEGQR